MRDLKVRTAALSSLASEAKDLREAHCEEDRLRTQIIINPRHEDEDEEEIEVREIPEPRKNGRQSLVTFKIPPEEITRYSVPFNLSLRCKICISSS